MTVGSGIRANIRVVEMGFGCVSLGTASSGCSWRSCIRLVREAVDAGVRVIDTADAYGSGASERIVGQALAGRRDDVVLATKAGYLFHERTHPEVIARRALRKVGKPLWDQRSSRNPQHNASTYAAQDFSPAYLRRAVEMSLRRLRTDHIDVLQLHGPAHPMPELLHELNDLITTGKVGRLGVGAATVEAAAEWSGTAGAEVLMMPFGLLDPHGVCCAVEDPDTGTELWARGVFGGGLFSAVDRQAEWVRAHPKFSLINQLRSLAADSGIDIYRLALGFVSANAMFSTAILGMGCREHLLRNIELASAGPLESDVLAAVCEIVTLASRRPEPNAR
jgi:aryl-alcohol dehydrogenase (NADP+)